MLVLSAGGQPLGSKINDRFRRKLSCFQAQGGTMVRFYIVGMARTGGTGAGDRKPRGENGVALAFSHSLVRPTDRPSAAQVSKKKGGNPAAEQRKAEKAKQLARNKQERQLQREAMLHVNDPAYLRAQLKELLDEEEHSGVLSSAQRLKKKTLQTAYEAALKKQIHAEAEKKRREAREGVIMNMDVSAIPLPSMPLPPGAKATMAERAERAERASAPLAPPSGPPPPPQQGYVMKSGGSAGGVVVSGASTVVARPKAQHDVALTSLVPSAVARGGGAGVGGMRPRGVKKAEAVPDNLDEFLNSLK